MSRDRAWWPIAIYPAAFPLSMVLLLWGQAEINVLELIRPAILAVAIALLITLVLSNAAGERRLGAIAATAAVVALIVDRVDASVLLVLLSLVVVVLARPPGGRDLRYLPLANTVLRVVATIALVAAGIAVVGRPGFVPDVQEAFLAPAGPAERPTPPAGTPDVFVYLIDGYPGRAGSSGVPGFDASAFPAELAARGFTVHDDSRTNYLLTRLVLPTMFEGRYVTDIPALAPPSGPDQATDARRLRTVLEHASGLAAIRAAGYDVMWVSSGWSHIDIRNVDRRIEAHGPSEFEVAALRQTGLGNLLQAIDPNGFARVMRDRIDAAYATAVTLASEPHDRPRFVFVHVPAPHPPTVFRADGSAEDGSPDAAWDTFHGSVESQDLRRERIFEQVTAIADRTLSGIDEVVAASVTPPVVVLFSDHGTDVGFDPSSPITSDPEHRSSSIVAALTPGHPDLFKATTSPINIIGTITNAYLGTSVDRQPDLTFGFERSVLDTVPIVIDPGD
jgi:hypothetical protein